MSRVLLSPPMMPLAELIACALRARSPRCRQAIASCTRSRAPPSISVTSWCGLASRMALLAPVWRYWLANARALCMSGALRVGRQRGELLGEEGTDRAHLRDHRVERGELPQVVGLDLFHAAVEREAVAVESLHARFQRFGTVADHAVVAQPGLERAGQWSAQRALVAEQALHRLRVLGHHVVEGGAVQAQ